MAIADEATIDEDGKQELTILETAEEKDSWAVMAEDPINPKLLTKQTRTVKGEKIYDMQCWDEVNNEWSDPAPYNLTDTTTSRTYECNGNVILVSSMAGLCNPNTCKNGGTCISTGASFSCVCAQGFSGPLCNDVAGSNCFSFDCSRAGGKKETLTQCVGGCSESHCCKSTAQQIQNTCGLITDARAYVQTGCCDRC